MLWFWKEQMELDMSFSLWVSRKTDWPYALRKWIKRRNKHNKGWVTTGIMDFMSSEQYDYFTAGTNPSACKVVEGREATREDEEVGRWRLGMAVGDSYEIWLPPETINLDLILRAINYDHSIKIHHFSDTWPQITPFPAHMTDWPPGSSQTHTKAKSRTLKQKGSSQKLQQWNRFSLGQESGLG